MPYLRIAVVVILTTLAQGNPSAYSTDFTDGASVLSQWTLAEECDHCSKTAHGLSSAHADECTQMTANATTFGKNGMVHTTTKADPTLSSCGAESNSGHATWNHGVLYGNFTVTAKWFPGASADVSTATGFIGLDSNGNEASITMGFHGDGWPKENEGSHKYQHGIYATNSKGTSHNRGYTTTDVSIADNLCTYGLLWSPSKVEWRFNGKVVRTVTDQSIIPSIKMHMRLHSRSGDGVTMPKGSTFTAQFTKFEYQPLSAEFLV